MIVPDVVEEGRSRARARGASCIRQWIFGDRGHTQVGEATVVVGLAVLRHLAEAE
jgi:hypothetical protein